MCSGAFGVVRHPNYSGYTMWRVGAAMISGSPTVTIAVFLANLGIFAGSIPDLTKHMKKRYPDQWPVRCSFSP
jgi:protein-S-isoprenylcysteine O-methyltransferase Ste14